MMIDDNLLRQVQICELEILDLFHSICRKYDIKYSLHGGTLLGAVRHGGFIPWDDDLDVIMLRGEYDRFMKAWEEEKPDGYYLQTKESEGAYTRSFAKIRKESTQFREEGEDPAQMHTGIYIDVEPIDRMPTQKLERILFWKDWFIYEIYSREYIPVDNAFFKFFGGLLLKTSSHEKRMRKRTELEKRIKQYNSQTDLPLIVTANYATMNRLLDSDTFDEYEEIPFEDKKYLAIKKREHLLTKWYGDYMKLPPENKRKNGHNVIEIQL